jgi:serine/threonine protein phosphatase 1
MSDLHGHYEKYIAMLQKINFQDDDMLYILGDILDRGPNPIKIILDVMKRPNVVVIAGNHCVMACRCLSLLMQEIKEESLADGKGEIIVEHLLNWQCNGAESTLEEFRKCDKKTQQKVVDFIADFELFEELEVNGNRYVLVHAGLGNFSPAKELWEYHLDELVWERADYEHKYYEDAYVITGHTPTQLIDGNPRPGYIYQANNHIAIDCGCCFLDGRLGCLRLEDMAEFYVERNEGK